MAFAAYATLLRGRFVAAIALVAAKHCADNARTRRGGAARFFTPATCAPVAPLLPRCACVAQRRDLLTAIAVARRYRRDAFSATLFGCVDAAA